MNQRVCTFRLGSLLCGFDLERLQELTRHPVQTPVPLAPPAVSGLLNLRGQLVTAINLRVRLGLGDGDQAPQDPVSIIAQTAEGPVALQVDAVEDVRSVTSDEIEAPPETLAEELRSVVQSVVTLDDRLLLLLDLDAVVSDLHEAVLE